MKLISLNIRGLGGHAKFLSLKFFLTGIGPHIVLLQETMSDVVRASTYLRPLFPDWSLVITAANGLSGGCAVLWDPRFFALTAFGFPGGIVLTGFCKGFKPRIHIINVYAPYHNKINFWQHLEECGFFMMKNIIMAGDYNCTFFPGEI